MARFSLHKKSNKTKSTIKSFLLPCFKSVGYGYGYGIGNIKWFYLAFYPQNLSHHKRYLGFISFCLACYGFFDLQWGVLGKATDFLENF